MNQSVQSILGLILLIQIFIYIWAFIENRFKPKIAQFKIIEADKIKLHRIAMIVVFSNYNEVFPGFLDKLSCEFNLWSEKTILKNNTLNVDVDSLLI